MAITQNFIGGIAISTMKPRAPDGTLGATTFTAVDSTKIQVIEGTTTLYNAQISVSIYKDSSIPVFSILRTTEVAPAKSPMAFTPAELPFDNQIVSGGEPADLGATPVNWSATVPAGVLQTGTDYTVIARDQDQTASVSQAIHTS